MATDKRARLHHEGDLVAAVDIGGSKALCLIARLGARGEGDCAPTVIGVGLHGMPHRERGGAWLHAAESSLRAAVEAAERMAGARLRAVTIAIPVGWRVDGEDAGTDPVGLAGSALTAEILRVHARAPHLSNCEALIERCSLRSAGIVAAPYAAAEAVLVEDEKELGVVLIDIGAASTDYAVFEGGAMVDCGGAPVGGDHITRDIAQIFGAPIGAAERIKTLQGSALSGPGDEHRLVEIGQLGSGGETLRVSRAELSAVIAPRLEEILELAAARMPETARSRFGVRRAVLTGGGSLLIGAREAAERVLGMKARIGRPAPIAGAPESARAPQYSVCAGAVLLAARKRARHAGFHQAPARRAASAALFGGVGHWLKENF
jgi:cell division protein FtsA